MKSAFASLLMVGALSLHPTRQAATDLEMHSSGATQFISYEDLLRLPQVQFTVSGDSNFPAPARLSGVSLDQLTKSLGMQADMVVALCGDGYRSNYPAAYLAAHHPVLVLSIDGKPQKDWPKTHDGTDLGPYLISHPSFTPAFKLLSHTDEPQIPFEVVRLDFRKESEVFGAIAPHGTFAPESPVMSGYRIAQQNCYRCHNMGDEGGQMASIPWPILAAMAKSSPDFFAKYVRTPQAVYPRSRMAGSPGYDDQTIAALRAYFATFAPGESQ